MITKNLIEDILGDLEMGLDCYINKETHEIISVPDEHEAADYDTWDDSFDELKMNADKYARIDKMPSSKSFKIMEDFTSCLENNSFKIQLLQALEGRKPFANFNSFIHNSSDYKELWFAFKQPRQVEWMQSYLKEILE